MNKKERMYERIENHGANLNAIFKTSFDNVELCKKLLRIERKAHHATTCLCNTNTLEWLDHPQPWTLEQATEEEQDKFFDKIINSVHKILGKESVGVVFINHDPRGYALKIYDVFAKNMKIHKDWGGFGILAPDLTNE